MVPIVKSMFYQKILAGIFLFISALFGIQILIMSFKILLKRKFLEGSAGFSLVVSILLFKIGFVSRSFGIFFNYSAFCLAILISQVNLFFLEYIFLFSENPEKRFIFGDRSAFLGKRGLYLNFLLFSLFSFFFSKVIWNLYLLGV